MLEYLGRTLDIDCPLEDCILAYSLLGRDAEILPNMSLNAPTPECVHSGSQCVLALIQDTSSVHCKSKTLKPKGGAIS